MKCAKCNAEVEVNAAEGVGVCPQCGARAEIWPEPSRAGEFFSKLFRFAMLTLLGLFLIGSVLIGGCIFLNR
jgi:DNA-directed RNA polymerase subunit RPC12/RpoP